jgi:TPR repeat protein
VWWFRKAAVQGGAQVTYNLSVMYRYGKGVLQDLEGAARWTRKAADQGHGNA